jgi:NAD(P)H dehydrogenase (quinone)
MTTRPIAVTGASGNIGGAVVSGLLDAGRTNVIALARNPARLGARQSGAAVRRADYDDRAELAAALAGVETLIFVSSDGEAAQMLVHHINVLDAAADSGIDRIVYLSILDVAPGSPFCFAPVHRETERMLRDRGIPHTTVRASIYSEFFTRWINKESASGPLALPMGTGRVSLVSRRDVARCLVACGLRNQEGLQLVTGNHSYDLAELAALTEKFTHASIKVNDVDLTDFCERLLREGVSPWWSYAFTSMFGSIREHRFEIVTDDVVKLTGQSPTPFCDVVERASDLPTSP